ncbi:MAG: hypothetical protein ACYTEX_16020 [Planctomycetota bacterium]
MVILRIRQAESALGDGRLDEAFELVQSESVRHHRRGQELTGRVARALAKRGQEHLAAARLAQALTDCNKADKVGGNLPEIAELRNAICRAMDQKRRGHERRRQKLARARHQMDNGWLSAGEEILGDGDGESVEQDMLQEQAAAIRLELETASGKAERALARGDLETAVEVLIKVDPVNRQNNDLAELVARVKSVCRQRAGDNLAKGRIDLADSLLRLIEPLAGQSIEIGELAKAVSHCRQAGGLISAGRAREAARLLQKVRAVVPSASWVKTALEQTQKAAEAIDGLRAGPLVLACSDIWDLGEHQDGGEDEGRRQADKSSGRQETAMKNAANGRQFDSVLDSKFVLQVDGVGSFLVLRDQSVTVGPISSSARPMLGLMADPNLPAVTIERTEGDYFIRCDRPIRVNDRAVTEKLLDDGDSIALSARCRFKFHLPNAASTTGILELSSSRLPRADIGRVILMDRDILIGAGSNNHIRTDRCDDKVTLLVRDGRMFCRARDITVNGKDYDSRTSIPLNTPIKIGSLSMVVAECKD